MMTLTFRNILLCAYMLSSVSSEGLDLSSRELPSMFQDAITRAGELLDSGLAAVDPRYDVSIQCLNHTEMFLEALVHGHPWAIRMIDAMGKLPSGLLDSHTRWLGSYDECIGIEASVEVSGVATSPYKGRYCTTELQVGPIGSIIPMEIGINVGLCVPNSCSTEDTSHLIETLFSLLQINTTSQPTPKVTCQYESIEYNTTAIAVLVVCSFFALVLVSATAYDVFLTHWLNRSNRSPRKYVVMRQTSSSMILPGDDGRVPSVSNHIDKYGSTADGEIATEEPVANGHVVEDTDKNRQHDSGQANPGLLGKILLSFSVYTNARKLLNVSQPSGTLTAVNGIRFVSMTWVILGHTYFFGLGVADNLLTFLPIAAKKFTYQAIMNALVSVDTFFTLSGLLVAYLSLKEMKKRGGALKFQWGLYYFHRFWRLTPPYMLFLMFYVPLMRHWSDGPIWPQGGTDINDCKDTWWTNLLYINNLVKRNEMCMGWSWYLANDMQFYVISPLMLIPLFYSKVFGILSCCAFILINFICTGVKSSENHLEPGMAEAMNPTFGDIYQKPWNRVGPYAVGFLAGYILYKTECKIKIPKRLNLLGWAVATTVALLVLYGLYDDSGQPQFSNGVAALYNATHRTAWAAVVCWVIIACATGHGGWVNTLLSWKGIIPLSRLTYCAYLVHPIVMMTYYYSRRMLVYYTDLEMSVLFCGFMVLSYGAAFIVSLAFESPMMGLEKVLLGRKKNS